MDRQQKLRPSQDGKKHAPVYPETVFRGHVPDEDIHRIYQTNGDRIGTLKEMAPAIEARAKLDPLGALKVWAADHGFWVQEATWDHTLSLVDDKGRIAARVPLLDLWSSGWVAVAESLEAGGIVDEGEREPSPRTREANLKGAFLRVMREVLTPDRVSALEGRTIDFVADEVASEINKLKKNSP